MTTDILTVSCPSKRGIVAAISSYLASQGCSISDSSQFDDVETGTFFMRVSFVSEEGKSLSEIAEGFSPIGAEWNMNFEFHDSTVRMKVILMVSRFGHCLNDILYRWKIGMLPIDIVGVISNHFDYQHLVLSHDLPFHHIKVTKDNKAEAEAELMAIVERTQADLIVLARYMQVLSDELCRRMPGRVINIHHSFLPGFKGAKPYHQAHKRGVKLIGATAHYVTAELDEGRSSNRKTIAVTHAQSADDYVSIGRDVESRTLARAIHAHIHHRVFVNGDRTIVFPASPDSYAADRVG